jgi:large subunit ribosomal protein L29
MANFSDIKDLSAAEVNGRLKELKEEALQLRIQHSAGQLENTARLRQVRREVAQLNTVLTAQTKAK